MAALLERYRVDAEPLRSERRAELLAVGLFALLCLQLLYSGIRLATLTAPAPIAPARDSLEVAEVVARAEVSEEESELITSRPLFWRTRRPLAADETASPVAKQEAQAKSGNIDKVKLRGVFGSGDSAGIIALVDGKQQRIMVGDTVEGWTLQEVRADRGVFDNAGRKWELVLKREAAPAKVAARKTK